jgi:hypothetical protein
MDDKTRGDIEHTIDEIKEEISAYDHDISWIFDDYQESPQLDFVKPVSSKSDFMLGYYLGRIYTRAWQEMIRNSCDKDDDFQELESIVKNRLPEIIKQISLCLGT